MQPYQLIPTREELQKRRQDKAAFFEERRQKRVAKSNRDAKLDAPRPGTSFFIATQRGLKRRSRSGITFGEQPIEVKVVSASADEIAARQKGGETVVNVAGAEDILADTRRTGGLMLHGLPLAMALEQAKAEVKEELDAERAKRAELEARLAAKDGAAAELDAERAKRAELEARLAKMEAALADATKGKSDGSPERLKANAGDAKKDEPKKG